ncbi:MAG: phosphate propanoyltransferase [Caldisericia bacterium]|nr:phosphate propanoyltransferase [Caldisericia bacterium]
MNIIEKAIEETLSKNDGLEINVGISARHVHLTNEHIKILFGHELTVYKDLTQPGQYAANEKVDVVGPKNTIKGVRILGPARKASQVEVSKTDAFFLGIEPTLKASGDIEGTPGIKLIGPNGEIALDKGVIVAVRHIHMHPTDAQKFGIVDKEVVWVVSNSKRKTLIGDVIVRVDPTFALDFHVDTDEANGAWLNSGDKIKIVR